jgi:hypothetical protein
MTDLLGQLALIRRMTVMAMSSLSVTASAVRQALDGSHAALARYAELSGPRRPGWNEVCGRVSEALRDHPFPEHADRFAACSRVYEALAPLYVDDPWEPSPRAVPERLFPILGEVRYGGVLVTVPYQLLESHAAQAQANHGQPLARLAERGGLTVDEVVAVLEDRPWQAMPIAVAVQRLQAHVQRCALGAALRGVAPWPWL